MLALTRYPAEAAIFAHQTMEDLVRLSDLVKRLLTLPRET
jgi:hypothetical protein